MDKSVLKTRIMTGLIFGAVVLGSLLAGKWTSTLFLIAVGCGCTWEYLRMAKPDKRMMRYAAVTIFLLLALYIVFDKPNVIWVQTLLIGSITFIVLAIFNFKYPLIKHDKLFIPVVFIYLMVPILVTLYYLHWVADQPTFILYTLLLIWISDSGAYFVGSWLGKNKLFEKISPKKTWEGFFGGGLFTVFAGILFWYTTESYSLIQWMLLAVSVLVFGTLGDLFESSIKRHYSVKDSGNFLPGHGGFLDRFDSFLFVLPCSIMIIFFW